MEYMVLKNGVKMPQLGYGVYFDMIRQPWTLKRRSIWKKTTLSSEKR